MQFKKYITLLASALLLFACAKEEFDTPTSTPDGPVTVGFWVGRGDTRTETPNAGFELDAPLGAETTRTHASSFGNNKLSVSWSNGDQVAMWAKPQDVDAFTFSNQTFKNWFVSADSQNAYFTTTLDDAMPAKNENNEDITYNYYVCYPTPASANGTITTFTIPSTQDGKMGGGADIMMAQGSGIALQSLDSDENFVVDKPEDYPSFTMKHLIHSLMFYVPAGEHWGFPDNETIERIVFTMPSSATATTATGIVTADATADTPALSTPTNGSNTIALNLTDPIGPSSGNDLDFAAAAIIPPSTTFGEGDNITIKVYTQTKAASQTISLIGRGAEAQYDNMRMAANRVTPVILNCSNVVDQYYLRFSYYGNNLGEPVTAVRVKYTDENNAAQTLHIDVNQFAKEGGFYDVDLTSWDTNTDFSALRTALSNQIVTIEYESEHAIVSNTAKLPDTTRPGVNDVPLTVPYLFFEDFSTISSFNSYDEYDSGFNSASKDAVSFLSGWTGARIGAQAGTSIRIASRRETSADYPARVDSAPLSGIKSGKTVNIKITYDYGVNYQGTHTGGQTILPGYVTSSEAYKSGDSIYKLFSGQDFSKISGTFAESDRFVVDGTDGSYTNTPETGSYTLYGRNNATRLTWAAVTKHQLGTNNTTSWLYLDNIKVQIVP